MHEIGISLPASSNTIANDLEKAIIAGFSHIELKWDHFTSQADQEKTITLLQNKDRGDISFSIHTPLQNINIGALSEIKRRKSVTSITEVIRLAEGFNTKFFVLHGGKIPVGLPRDRKTKDKACSAQLKSIEEINLFCKERGVIIALENGYTTKDLGLLITIDDMAQLDELFDDLSFILDIGHFIINNPVSNIQKQLKKHPHLQFRGIHLHDNKQTADDHLALGYGILLQKKEELKAILNLINKIPIIIENLGLNAALITRSNLLKFIL